MGVERETKKGEKYDFFGSVISFCSRKSGKEDLREGVIKIKEKQV